MIDEKRLAQMMVDKYNEYWNRADIFEAIETQMAMSVMLSIHTMMDSLPKVSEWIPCSERLPDKSGRYLITVKDIGVASCYFNLGYKEHWGINNGKYKEDYVLAWMPLPEPYREGDV